MSTYNIPFPNLKKKIILNYPKSAAMGFVQRDLKTSLKQPWYTSGAISVQAIEVLLYIYARIYAIT